MEIALWVLAYLFWGAVGGYGLVWLITREPKQKT